MTKKLLIFVFFAVSFTGGAIAQNCTGNKVPCCPGGQKSCCSPLHCDPYSGPCQSYDISCWGQPGIVCPSGQINLNGTCVDMPSILEPEEPTLILGCQSFVSEAGHSVPYTEIGGSVVFGCYTYTCASLALWQTASTCQCKPGITYYEPCGDCGTRSRTCGQDGVYGAWSACAAM